MNKNRLSNLRFFLLVLLIAAGIVGITIWKYHIKAEQLTWLTGRTVSPWEVFIHRF